jgi:F-type H+-transporting ATPase subunit delta
VKQYFVSSGFTFVHTNSVVDIVAIEAVPLGRLDPEEVRKGVQEYAQKVTSAKDELERAETQIGLEVHSTLQGTLGGSAS